MSQIQKDLKHKDCSFGKICGGCSDWTHPYETQLQKKITALTELKNNLLKANSTSNQVEIEVLQLSDRGLRDRMELSYDSENRQWGFFDNSGQFKIVAVSECLMLSPPLQKLFQDFQSFSSKVFFSFTKANLRLRVCYDPNEQLPNRKVKRGVWFDLPNLSTKSLLEEKTYLNELLKVVDIVEIGQKRKKLVKFGNDFKLKDPETDHWFYSYSDQQTIPLHTCVGSFTQPSLEANRLICANLENWIAQSRIKNAVEFGSGCGNLSFAAAKHLEHLLCLEIDALSILGMRKTLAALKAADPNFNPDKFKIWQGDFQRLRSDLKDANMIEPIDLAIVNPPRSGLKEFTESIVELNPRYVFYMSCYPESFAEDCKKLLQHNYSFKKLALLDQFPHTDHYEILAMLELS